MLRTIKKLCLSLIFVGLSCFGMDKHHFGDGLRLLAGDIKSGIELLANAGSNMLTLVETPEINASDSHEQPVQYNYDMPLSYDEHTISSSSDNQSTSSNQNGSSYSSPKQDGWQETILIQRQGPDEIKAIAIKPNKSGAGYDVQTITRTAKSSNSNTEQNNPPENDQEIAHNNNPIKTVPINSGKSKADSTIPQVLYTDHDALIKNMNNYDPFAKNNTSTTLSEYNENLQHAKDLKQIQRLQQECNALTPEAQAQQILTERDAFIHAAATLAIPDIITKKNTSDTHLSFDTKQLAELSEQLRSEGLYPYDKNYHENLLKLQNPTSIKEHLTDRLKLNKLESSIMTAEEIIKHCNDRIAQHDNALIDKSTAYLTSLRTCAEVCNENEKLEQEIKRLKPEIDRATKDVATKRYKTESIKTEISILNDDPFLKIRPFKTKRIAEKTVIYTQDNEKLTLAEKELAKLKNASYEAKIKLDLGYTEVAQRIKQQQIDLQQTLQQLNSLHNSRPLNEDGQHIVKAITHALNSNTTKQNQSKLIANAKEYLGLFRLSTKQYALSEHSQQIVQSAGLSLESFIQKTGNSFEQRAHQQAIDLINTAAKNTEKYPHEKLVVNTTHYVVGLAHESVLCGGQGNVEKARILNNLGQQVLDYSIMFIQHAKECTDELIALDKMVQDCLFSANKSTIKGISTGIERVWHSVTHLPETLRGMGQGIATIAKFVLFSQRFEDGTAITFDSKYNKEQIDQLAKDADVVRQTIDALVGHVKNMSADEIIQEGVAFTVESVLTGKLINIVGAASHVAKIRGLQHLHAAKEAIKDSGTLANLESKITSALDKFDQTITQANQAQAAIAGTKVKIPAKSIEKTAALIEAENIGGQAAKAGGKQAIKTAAEIAQAECDAIRQIIFNRTRNITIEEAHKIGFRAPKIHSLDEFNKITGRISYNMEWPGGMEKARQTLDALKNEFCNNGRTLVKEISRLEKNNIQRTFYEFNDGSSIQLRSLGKSGHPKIDIIDTLKNIEEKITFK